MKLANDFDLANVDDQPAVIPQPRLVEREPIKPFHVGDQRSLGASLNEEFWRWGITINQGLGWSVSLEQAQQRLNYIRVTMLRLIFGNNFRRNGRKIWFCMFKQGSCKTDNQHFHALMGIEGSHDWSDHHSYLRKFDWDV
jgi:hypothetical protein